MSRIFMDGFEDGTLSSWVVLGSGVISSGIAGKTGAYCGYLSNNGSMTATLSQSMSSIYTAYKMRWPTELTTSYIAGFHFLAGATTLGLLGVGPLYAPFCWGTSTSNVVAYTSFPQPTTWALVEIYYVPHLTNGTVIVKINGVTNINVSGVKTASETSNVSAIRFYVTNVIPFYFDDVIVDDANWIGSTSIQGLAVTGAGATTQFDPSTGNNYACVDEVPPSDADYISTNTPNEIDTYACGDLTGTINSIKAVQVQARCMQEGSPAVPKIQLVTRPSSTNRVSSSKDVQTFQPGTVSNIWELNPDDSAAWEEADVNGMEIGVKAVAS